MKKILGLQKLFSILFTFGFLVILLFFTGKNIPTVYGDNASDCEAWDCYSPSVLLRLNGNPYPPRPCRSKTSSACAEGAPWSCTACPEPRAPGGGSGGTPLDDCVAIKCFNPKVLLRYKGISAGDCLSATSTSCSLGGDWTCTACPAAPYDPPPDPTCPEPKKLIINYYIRTGGNCIHGGDILYDYNWRTINGTDEKFGIDTMNVSCSILDRDKKVQEKAIADAGGIQPDQEVTVNGSVIQNAPANPNPNCNAPPYVQPPGPPCAEWGTGSQEGVCLKVATSLFQGKNKSDGDISTDPGQFVVRIFTIILSFAGGIALLLIISAGYKIIVSKGKPEGIQQGREQLISAIVGLVFIIFSFVIFQLVVADLLKIPGIE